jgi:nucleotide-binding universal stress UspA family protein
MNRFHHILFPLDFSERSHAAAPFVLSMAQQNHSKVSLVHAIEPAPPIYGAMNSVFPDTLDYREIETVLKARMAEFAAKELPKIEVSTSVEIGDPAAVIVDYAEANGVDLIAMTTHGYGTFRRLLLGSVSAKVLHDAKVAVWTTAHAPEPSHRAHPLPRHIVVALDLHPHSKRTMELALEIAKGTGADVEILHIAPEGQTVSEGAEAQVGSILQAAASQQEVEVHSESTSEASEVLAGGTIAEQVRSLALRKRADLVIIGHGHTHTGIMGRLKNVSYSIVREAPCPVLSF